VERRALTRWWGTLSIQRDPGRVGEILRSAQDDKQVAMRTIPSSLPWSKCLRVVIPNRDRDRVQR